MDGKYQLLKHPEFRDYERANRFYHAVQQEHMVAGYMMEMKQEQEDRQAENCDWDIDCLETHDGSAQDSLVVQTPKPAYMVRIGQEIALEGMEDMSFITTTYRIGNEITGQIGVIGPKRMQYGNIISQISFVNKALTEAAGEHYVGSGDSDKLDGHNDEKG